MGREGGGEEGGGEEMMAMGGGGASCTGFEDLYSATRLFYAENGRTVNYLSQQQWCWYDGYTCTAGCGDCPRPTSYTVLNATEYRYDQARERYYELGLDPAEFKAGDIAPLGTEVPIWMDFENGEAYSRYRIDGPTSILSLVRYEPGLWRSDNSASAYLHNDHLGTLRYTSSSLGTPQNPTAFSAFGEQISGSHGPEFGYAGAFGYHRDSASSFLHLGHRYYDPASGRFLQRDPIGIRGGANVYRYAANSPQMWVDPEGLTVVDRITEGGAIGGAVGGLIGGGAGAIGGAAAGGAGAAPGAVAGTVTGGTIGAVYGAMVGFCYGVGEVIAPYVGPVLVPVVGPGQGPGIPEPRWRFRGGLGACFPTGTLVETESGPVAIEFLVAGLAVKSADAREEMISLAGVASIIESFASELVEIQLGQELLLATPEHPFWVINRGWVPAARLQKGDMLLNEDGDHVSIQEANLRQLNGIIPVYNITVTGEHTFFVGRSRVLVHNKQ